VAFLVRPPWAFDARTLDRHAEERERECQTGLGKEEEPGGDLIRREERQPRVHACFTYPYPLTFV
jgi:hypothetical protein